MSKRPAPFPGQPNQYPPTPAPNQPYNPNYLAPPSNQRPTAPETLSRGPSRKSSDLSAGESSLFDVSPHLSGNNSPNRPGPLAGAKQKATAWMNDDPATIRARQEAAVLQRAAEEARLEKRKNINERAALLREQKRQEEALRRSQLEQAARSAGLPGSDQPVQVPMLSQSSARRGQALAPIDRSGTQSVAPEQYRPIPPRHGGYYDASAAQHPSLSQLPQRSATARPGVRSNTTVERNWGPGFQAPQAAPNDPLERFRSPDPVGQLPGSRRPPPGGRR
ncbi:hypothetical protein EMMF5_005831 [Cystobasidiomycetes sp. EMM_F5]